jgi:translation initiation factor IF-3
MIMFLTPRKTPLLKKDDKDSSVHQAIRTIPAPPRSTAAKVAAPQA